MSARWVDSLAQAAEVSISVVVPNRNDSRYLRRCIGSILEQDGGPDELIILDDESTDDSVTVIEEAIAGCAYARLVQNAKNLGATENANRGLALATGRFVHFLGANDFVLPGLYAAARSALSKCPETGIWSAMVWAVDEEDRFLRIHPSPVLSCRGTYLSPGEVRKLIYRFGNWLTGQSTIYRRDALVKQGGFNPNLRALTDLISAHVLASRHGAYFQPEPLAAMRLHAGSFLTETVQDERVFDRVLSLLETEGPRLDPELFTERLLARTRRRLRFSSLRSVLSSSSAAARDRMSRAPERVVRALSKAAGLLPSPMVAVLLFLAMRPHDLLPTLWYRYLGTMLVAMRHRRND